LAAVAIGALLNPAQLALPRGGAEDILAAAGISVAVLRTLARDILVAFAGSGALTLDPRETGVLISAMPLTLAVPTCADRVAVIYVPRESAQSRW
jgi:hypothetical protein